MILSLRARVLLLIVSVNAALFVAGGVYLGRRLAAANDRLVRYMVENLDVLGAAVRSNIEPRGELNVAPILEWEAWSLLDDAMLVDRRVQVGRDGTYVPLGIDLNPLGSVGRSAGFDRQAVLAAMVDAMGTGAAVTVEGGRALPILADGSAWGGCWFRLQPPVDFGAMFGDLVPLFLLSTLLLSGVTFLALRTLVLAPVEMLAGGARRVREGDLSVRLVEPKRRDEMADLVRSFNAMTSFVQGFNERLAEEVRAATSQARQAEAAAMTQRRLAAMGELAAGIAHEINNPLGGLQNATEALRRADLSADKRRQYLDLLASGLERIGTTVARLRRFTPRAATLEPVDLEAVARDSIALIRHRAERLGVTLDLGVEAPARGVRVQGARNEIGQALLNLLTNSLDALEDAGPRAPAARIALGVALATEPDADGVVRRGVAVEVGDNGPGVAPGELERVFDLFYTTKEVGKGTGLGLALVHSTMREHGGTVRIASEEGRFFLVRLWFPLEAARAAEGEA